MSEKKLNCKTGLPLGWIVSYSKSNQREFFINEDTKKSFWEPPQETNVMKLKEFLIENPFAVHAKHILVKHKGSRRPYSHRSAAKITMTKEDALKELGKLRKQIMEIENEDERFAKFEDIAVKRSDCGSSKAKGDLGIFGKGAMQPSFEKISFQLLPGEISDTFESDSGVHIVWRVA
ncbi:hypothetical protein QEN19_001580 [Hanseniaspora menglaensis]